MGDFEMDFEIDDMDPLRRVREGMATVLGSEEPIPAPCFCPDCVRYQHDGHGLRRGDRSESGFCSPCETAGCDGCGPCRVNRTGSDQSCTLDCDCDDNCSCYPSTAREE